MFRLPHVPKGVSTLQRRHYSRIQRAQEKPIVELASSCLTPVNNNVTDRPLLILHGLFGSKRNWKSLCKAFHRDLPGRAVYALDLRNHGSSPHAKPMTYESMADDVKHFIATNGLKNVALLGHSMGGKVAMAVALSLGAAGKTDIISHLIVGDMAPIRLQLSPRLSQYISAMQDVNGMPRGMIKTLADADRVLVPFEPDLSVRQFLLTNLVLASHSRAANPHLDKSKFQLPLDILQAAIPALGEFPFDYQSSERPIWNGPTLAIEGSKSEYKIGDHYDSFEAFFPKVRMETLEAGHWVHAERPNEFRKLVVDFLNSP